MEEGRTEVLEKEKLNGRLWLVSIIYATGVLLDYFLVYAVKINDDYKCIDLSKGLGYSAFAFRLLLEILNTIMFCTMFNFKKFNFKKFNFKNFMSNLQKKEAMKKVSKHLLGIAITREDFPDFLNFHQFLSIFLVAIVCEVMIMISLATSKTSLISIAIYYLLGLHLPRLWAVVTILLKRPMTSSSRFRTKLLRLFLFVFVYSIQLFAALWYLTAIYKETRCWKKAYKNSTGRSYYSVFNCSGMSQHEDKFVRNYCSTDTKNYSFGIYKKVHNSGVLWNQSSAVQILYFSRWSLQYLSSFAQGLEAGDSVWQNIFIIFIIVYAVFMFFFLIGEVQSEWERFAKLKPKLREKKQWMGRKKICAVLQSKIKKNERDNWPEIKDVNIENMFSNLPEELSVRLSEKLCSELLRKVKAFGELTEESRKELCNCVKPVFYEKHTRVIREGDPIDEMLFVVQGKLWTYRSGSETKYSESTSSCNDNENDCLKDGDFHGKELIQLLQANPQSLDFPKSPMTIQAVTNVEAFVLMAYDLKKIFIEQKNPKQEADTTNTG